MIQSLSVMPLIYATISVILCGLAHPILVMIADQAYLILING